MKKLLALAVTALILLPSASKAQDKFEANLKVGIVTHYMWRGLDMADISLQPEASIAWKGLSLRAGASTGFSKDDLQDIDLTLGYTRWGVNIGVTDYWTKDVDARNRFFYFSGGMESPHQLEVNLGYSCKYGSIHAHTMVAGNDYRIDGKRAYSTFIELDVPFRAVGIDWDIRAGVSPLESAGTTYEEQTTDEKGRAKTVTRGTWMYGEKFCCNMAAVRATKNFEFKHFRLPVFVELYTNPYLQTAQVVAGVAIATL